MDDATGNILGFLLRGLSRAAIAKQDDVHIDQAEIEVVMNHIRGQAAEIERLKCVIEDIPGEVRAHWTFDAYQHHTHTWHDRENCIEWLTALGRSARQFEQAAKNQGGGDEA